MDVPDEPILDTVVLDELAASVGGDRGFVADLIQTYLADSSGQVDAVEAAVPAGDAEALVRPAHTLKSSSATLGAKQLSALARRLEMTGRSGSLDDDARADATLLREAWQSATGALRAWMAGESG